MIRRKLMKAERSPRSIELQYKYTTSLDRHQRENKREKKLKEKKKQRVRTETDGNNKQLEKFQTMAIPTSDIPKR